MKKTLLLFLSICLASCAFTPQISMQAGGTAMEVNERVPLVLAVDYSPDGKTIAAGGGGGAVRIWDMATGKEYALPGYSGDTIPVILENNYEYDIARLLISYSWLHPKGYVARVRGNDTSFLMS